MSSICVIIKKGDLNWSGKEFSDLPAKIYSDAFDAFQTIAGYYVHNEMEAGTVEFVFLTEDKKKKLLDAQKIRI